MSEINFEKDLYKALQKSEVEDGPSGYPDEYLKSVARFGAMIEVSDIDIREIAFLGSIEDRRVRLIWEKEFNVGSNNFQKLIMDGHSAWYTYLRKESLWVKDKNA